MAWEIISDVEVASLIGTSPEKIRDQWYEFAVAMIEDYTGLYNLAETLTVTERVSGTGTKVVPVSRPPIQSITSVSIVDDGVIDSANYIFNDGYIIMDDDIVGANPYKSYGVWPRGIKNIEVTYTSGSSATNHKIGLAIALMIKQMMDMSRGEGSQAYIQFRNPDIKEGTEVPVSLTYQLWEIMDKLLSRKMRAR